MRGWAKCQTPPPPDKMKALLYLYSSLQFSVSHLQWIAYDNNTSREVSASCSLSFGIRKHLRTLHCRQKWIQGWMKNSSVNQITRVWNMDILPTPQMKKLRGKSKWFAQIKKLVNGRAGTEFTCLHNKIYWLPTTSQTPHYGPSQVNSRKSPYFFTCCFNLFPPVVVKGSTAYRQHSYLTFNCSNKEVSSHCIGLHKHGKI